MPRMRETKPAPRPPAAKTESPARRETEVRRSTTGLKLAVLVADLVLLAAAYTAVRDLYVDRAAQRVAQRILNSFASVSVERIGSVDVTLDGDLVLHDTLATTSRNGVVRPFYRARRIELALDRNPILDDRARVMRVDLFHPEIWIVRDQDSDWNVMWSFLPSQVAPTAPPSGPPPPPPPPPPPDEVVRPPRDPFPANGVHIHEGLVNVVFVGDGGRETVWQIGRVHGVFTRRADGGLSFGPLTGTFYGGRIRAELEMPPTDAFVLESRITITGADIARMAENLPRLKGQVTGRFDMVFSGTRDGVRADGVPVGAGRVRVSGGKLWDLPAFVGVLGVFALTAPGEQALTESEILFTWERTHVRIDRMDFLGQPLSLFGSGRMDVDGQNLNVTLVPRLGASLGDIVPIGGHILQAILDIAKGALIPVTITGSFWEPKISVVPDAPVDESVRKAAEAHPTPK